MIRLRRGPHLLATTEDRLGRHHACSCGLFSMPADDREIATGTGMRFVAAPAELAVIDRWRDHTRHASTRRLAA